MNEPNQRVIDGVAFWVDEHGRVCSEGCITDFVSLDEAEYVAKMERIRDSFG